jgi:hypothetical protein
MTAPTPWFYTVETASKKAVSVLRDNNGVPVGITHDEDIAKLIIHAINTVPQLHMNQLMKATPEEEGEVRHTVCYRCNLDIEGFFPFEAGQWLDRGNNRNCADGQAHFPMKEN